MHLTIIQNPKHAQHVAFEEIPLASKSVHWRNPPYSVRILGIDEVLQEMRGQGRQNTRDLYP